MVQESYYWRLSTSQRLISLEITNSGQKARQTLERTPAAAHNHTKQSNVDAKGSRWRAKGKIPRKERLESNRHNQKSPQTKKDDSPTEKIRNKRKPWESETVDLTQDGLGWRETTVVDDKTKANATKNFQGGPATTSRRLLVLQRQVEEEM